jgi:ABC-type lipoprotein export system ATPase subunit
VEQKPSLKIVGLHVEGLRALRRVDWPTDGNGWNGTVPDMVMVGGVNGSGKTTLLELIAKVAMSLADEVVIDREPPTLRARVDFEITTRASGQLVFSVLIGDESLVSHQKINNGLCLVRGAEGYLTNPVGSFWNKTYPMLRSAEFANSDFPSVIYLPANRELYIPEEKYKAAGKLGFVGNFFYRFAAPEKWKDSLEALLYAARWADLNAKEEGHPERATHFESYARTFQFFFGDAKRLTWHDGELFVEIADTGALHPLMKLSSGEKQAIILAAELYRRWRPGSLVLIDEPELHFHTSWQTTLWTMLEQWQKERGGQVIVATQSTHLFRIASPDTTVLLGGPLG